MLASGSSVAALSTVIEECETTATTDVFAITLITGGGPLGHTSYVRKSCEAKAEAE